MNALRVALALLLVLGAGQGAQAARPHAKAVQTPSAQASGHLCGRAQYDPAVRPGQAIEISCTFPEVSTHLSCPGALPAAAVEIWDQLCSPVYGRLP